MATRFRHIGCKSVVIVYCGEQEVKRGLCMRAADWAIPDGPGFEYGAPIPQLACSDCGQPVRLGSVDIEPIPREEKPWR